jgi:hypothetical protein
VSYEAWPALDLLLLDSLTNDKSAHAGVEVRQAELVECLALIRHIPKVAVALGIEGVDEEEVEGRIGQEGVAIGQHKVADGVLDPLERGE